MSDAELNLTQTPQVRAAPRIDLSMCREGDSVDKNSGRIGDFRVDQVACLGTIAA